MKLTVLIPAYNEEHTIVQVLARVASVSLPIAREVIVVDDGSTDATRARIDAVRSQYPELTILQMPHNSGKGAAIAHGLTRATGDIVVIQDADLEVDPAEHPRLLRPMLEGGAPVVYGSRFLGQRRPWSVTLFANRLLTRLTNLLYGARISDMETAYKMIRRDAFERLNLECRRFDFEPEVTAKLLRCGYPIAEVPISYNPRTRKEGKKIGWRDGLVAIERLVRYRFTPMVRIARTAPPVAAVPGPSRE